MKRLLTVFTSAFLAIAILMASQASPSAWNSFLNASRNWTQSVAGLFTKSHFAQIVSADAIEDELNNWQNWPSSQKHKSFAEMSGEWFLPFEVFEQQYYRGWQSKSIKPRYFDHPYSLDLNGDGLLDILYSKAEITWDSGGHFQWNGLEQYILLRRATGFELAYKCYQKSVYTIIPPEYRNIGENRWWYYGDCADTSYISGTDLAYEKKWNPAAIWMQQTPNWDAMITPSDVTFSTHYGNGLARLQYLNVDFNKNGEYVETFDRSMPVFRDLNGDGLVDVLYEGIQIHGQGAYNAGPYPYISISFIMMNTGKGFEIVSAGVGDPYNWIPEYNPYPAN